VSRTLGQARLPPIIDLRASIRGAVRPRGSWWHASLWPDVPC